MIENTYWGSKGKHQVYVDRLNDLVPHEGSVSEPRKNKALEKFRRASNCYYDLYNNGLCNRASEFREVFGIASSRYRLRDRYSWFAESMLELVEARMDDIVAAAAAEQGIAV